MERPINPRGGPIMPRPQITNKFINRTHIPDKIINEQIYFELNASLDTGNISKAKTLIQENPTLLNYKNSIDGNTPLHVLLQSSTVLNEDKLILTKYMLLRGASPSIPNKFNITPLHIAVKNQLGEIVKLLLDYKANPNQLDSNNMNALHYAVLGKKMDTCPDFKEKKDIKKEQNAPGITELVNISNDLQDLLFKWDNSKVLLENLFNYINNFDDKYTEPIDKIKKSLNEKILKIKLNTTKNDLTKESEINKLIMDTIEEINNELIKEIKKQIETNPQNKLEFNKKADDDSISLIEKVNEANLINNMEIKNILDYAKINNSAFRKLDVLSDDVLKKIDELKEKTEEIYWFNKGLQVNYYFNDTFGDAVSVIRNTRRALFINLINGPPAIAPAHILPPDNPDRYLTFIPESKMELLDSVEEDDELLKDIDYMFMQGFPANKLDITDYEGFDIFRDDTKLNPKYSYLFRKGPPPVHHSLIHHSELINMKDSENFPYKSMDLSKSITNPGVPDIQLFSESEIKTNLTNKMKQTYIKPIYLMVHRINNLIDTYNKNLDVMMTYLENGELFNIYACIIPINLYCCLNINLLRIKIKNYIDSKIEDLTRLNEIFMANFKKISEFPEFIDNFKHGRIYNHITTLITESKKILKELNNTYFNDDKILIDNLNKCSENIKKLTSQFNLINDFNLLKKYHDNFKSLDFFEAHFENDDLTIDFTNFSEINFDNLDEELGKIFNNLEFNYINSANFSDVDKYPQIYLFEPHFNKINPLQYNDKKFKTYNKVHDNFIDLYIKINKIKRNYDKKYSYWFIQSKILDNHFITSQSSIAKETSNLLVSDDDSVDIKSITDNLKGLLRRYTDKYLKDYTVDVNEFKLKLIYGLVHEMIEKYIKSNIYQKSLQIVYDSDSTRVMKKILPLQFPASVSLMKMSLNEIKLDFNYSKILDNDIFLEDKEKDKKINYVKKDDLSCYKIDFDIIENLLKNRVDLNQKDNNNKIPVIYAIENKNLDLVKKLIPNYKNQESLSFYKNNQEMKNYFSHLLTNTIEEVVYNNSYDTFYEKYKNKVIRKLNSKSEINTNILSSIEYTVPFYMFLLNDFILFYTKKNIFISCSTPKISLINIDFLGLNSENPIINLMDIITDKTKYYDYKEKININNKYKLLFDEIETKKNKIDKTKILKYYKNFIKKYSNEKDKHINYNIHLNMISKINTDKKELIYRIFEKLEIFARDYKECPDEYNNENANLLVITDFIIHVLEHSVLNYLYNAIVKLFIKEIEINNPTISKEEITDKLKKILEDSSIYNYIMHEMGEKLVKKTLNRYDGEADPDIFIDFDTIFRNLKIIINQKLVGVIDSKNFNSNFDSFIYPYFREYSKVIIQELDELTNNFMNHLLGMKKLLEIYTIFN